MRKVTTEIQYCYPGRGLGFYEQQVQCDGEVKTEHAVVFYTEGNHTEWASVREQLHPLVLDVKAFTSVDKMREAFRRVSNHFDTQWENKEERAFFDDLNARFKALQAALALTEQRKGIDYGSLYNDLLAMVRSYSRRDFVETTVKKFNEDPDNSALYLAVKLKGSFNKELLRYLMNYLGEDLLREHLDRITMEEDESR